MPTSSRNALVHAVSGAVTADGAGTSRRTLLGWLGVGLCTAWSDRVCAQGPAGGPLPRRNLIIELRETEAAGAAIPEPGAGGAVVFGSAGGVAAGGVQVATQRRSGALASGQRLLVLNGAEAEARVGRREPMQWLQWAWTDRGPEMIGGGEWVESGRGVRLQPRWPGGGAPVTVTIRHDVTATRSPGLPSRFDPDGQPRSEPTGLDGIGVLTTVTVPLGEWIAIASARTGDEAAERREAPGTVSSRDAVLERRVRLEMRVGLAN